MNNRSTYVFQLETSYEYNSRSRMTSILAMDSRGRGIEAYTQDNWKYQHIITIIQPGATISHLQSLITDYLHTHHCPRPITIQYAAGICDLTYKISHHDGTEVWFDEHANRTEHLISQIATTNDFFRSQDINIRFATIPPVSLPKSQEHRIHTHQLHHSIFSPDHIDHQQHHLLLAITSVNKFISHLNTSNNEPIINLHHDLIKSITKIRGKNNQKKKKITRTFYTHLFYGVHPDQFLTSRWFDLQCSYLCHQIVSSSSEEEEDEDERTWDFKRI